jgi:hypothetical protein
MFAYQLFWCQSLPASGLMPTASTTGDDGVAGFRLKRNTEAIFAFNTGGEKQRAGAPLVPSMAVISTDVAAVREGSNPGPCQLQFFI